VIPGVGDSPGGVNLDVLESLRGDPTPAAVDGCAVHDLVLEVHEHPRVGPPVCRIDENCTLLEGLSVSFQQHPDRRLQERMAGSQQSRCRLPWLVDVRTLEADPLVRRQEPAKPSRTVVLA
jgi:hypothetical protein